MDVSEYTSKIPPEHRQPKMIATVKLNTQGYVDTMNLLATFPALFDVDTAVGEQLDFVGANVNVDRQLQAAIDTPGGVVYTLNDDDFRTLVKARIAANHWDGTIPGAYNVLAIAFGPDYTFLIQDYQDETMAIGIIGPPLSDVAKALLVRGELLIKPADVRIAGYVVPSVPGAPIFGLDVENDNIAGLDVGCWALEV